MKNIIVALNPSKDKDGKILSLVIEEITKVFKYSKITVLNSYEMSKYKFDNKLDLLIVLGGDGTLLGIARDINGNDENNEKGKALNDVVIARGTLSRMVKFEVFIDNKLYYRFKGDGIIIATPTGSTGYSFSAGGPFIYPDVDVITLTPICPHTRGMQPIVLKSSSEILIKAENYNGEIYLTFDGQEAKQINDNTSIIIKKSDYLAKIMLFDNYDYFNVLRQKILDN